MVWRRRLAVAVWEWRRRPRRRNAKLKAYSPKLKANLIAFRKPCYQQLVARLFYYVQLFLQYPTQSAKFLPYNNYEL